MILLYKYTYKYEKNQACLQFFFMKMTEINDLPDINRRIYDLVQRKAGGNITKFAAMIGLKHQTVNRLFKKDTRNEKYPEVSLDVVSAISENLNVSIDYLVNGIEVEQQELKEPEWKYGSVKANEGSSPFLKMIQEKDELLTEKDKQIVKLSERIDKLTDDLVESLKKK